MHPGNTTNMGTRYYPHVSDNERISLYPGIISISGGIQYLKEGHIFTSVTQWTSVKHSHNIEKIILQSLPLFLKMQYSVNYYVPIQQDESRKWILQFYTVLLIFIYFFFTSHLPIFIFFITTHFLAICLKKKIRINTYSLQISGYWNNRGTYLMWKSRSATLETTASSCHILCEWYSSINGRILSNWLTVEYSIIISDSRLCDWTYQNTWCAQCKIIIM